MSTKTVLDELVISSASELFAARGIEVRSKEGSEASIEYASTLGFSSDLMRGVIGIGMSPDTMQRLMSADRHAGPACNGEDWLAESVNQLLGRLKTKLMGYGVVMSIALPTVLQGLRLQFLGRGSTSLWTYGLETDMGPFWVWLDVRCERELVLTAQSDPDLQGTPEGELVLF